MNYTTTPLEDSIQQLYNQLGIGASEEIDESTIAMSLNLGIKYIDGNSHFFKIKGKYYILINSNLPKKECWQQFAHELCHVLKHVGNQLNMPVLLMELQEWQAKKLCTSLLCTNFHGIKRKTTIISYRSHLSY